MNRIKLTDNNFEEVINKACEVLSKGGIIIYPTETTYGMGVDPTNQSAVDKLFSYKEKREGKPISVAVLDKEMASKYVEINETAENLYSNFLPGPITVVSTGKHILAKGVESALGTLGIRIPDYKFALEMVKTYGKPITATSANASYQKRPYSIDDILETTSKRQQDLVGLFIDAGELPHNDPSTVVDTTLNEISVLRQGNIVLSDFEHTLTHNTEQTIEFAKEMMNKYADSIGKKPIIIALQGDMGAGKTHFSKGIAQALGIEKVISSPTYVLEKDYKFNHKGFTGEFIHIDTWRMFSKEEFEELKLDKRIAEKDIISIEWAEKVYNLLKTFAKDAIVIWVKINTSKEIETDREILYSDSFLK